MKLEMKRRIQRNGVAKYCAIMSVSVCLSVCVSVRLHISKTECPNFTKLSSVHVAVARSSSGDNAVHYVLPGLWMTSCFHTMMPRVGSKTTSFVEFARWRHRGKVSVYECFIGNATTEWGRYEQTDYISIALRVAPIKAGL